MKKNIATLLLMFAGFGAWADDTTNTNLVAQPIQKTSAQSEMAREIGVGVILGEPIGASLKYFLNDTLAIDGALGWSAHDHTDLYLHSDVLWHNFDLFPVSPGKAPVYFGVGGLVRFRNSGDDNQFGIRVPLGVSYLFSNAPLDIFAEIGPALDLTPAVRGEITGGIGIRFWF